MESSSSNLQSRPSSSGPYMNMIPPHRTQLHPRMHLNTFSSPFPPNSRPSSSSLQSHTKWLLLCASIFTVPFFFYLFSTAHKIHLSSKFSEPRSSFFGLVIDAGPTGSRIRVFEFLGEGRIPFMDGTGSSSMKVQPGLVDFAAETEMKREGAGESIQRLIKFAKRRVPRKEWKNTKVQLMARMELDNLGSKLRENILESCRRVLRSSGFVFKDEWARVIGGEEEGVYVWVAANYALGTLGREPEATSGIVELGGDSLQVAFAVKETLEMPSSRVIKLFGATYSLHIQSIPQFGQEAAWKSMHEQHNSRELTSLKDGDKEIPGNPCIPRGYNLEKNAQDTKLWTSDPAGNFSACRLEALSYLKRTLHSSATCPHPPCNIMSSFIELQGKPVSSDNFLFATEFFGLVPSDSLLDVETAGRHYCEDGWDRLQKQHRGIVDMDLVKYCFSSAYLVAVLHEGFGIPPLNEKRIGFGNHSGSIPLDLTIGAFIVETMMIVPLQIKLEPDNMDGIVGNDSITYFSLFAFLLIAVFAAFFVLQWRKPQLKTVYDLEKGHYIVTRVPR